MWTRGGRRRAMGLGGYPALSLAGAREKARACNDQVALGRDPIAERGPVQNLTFADIAEQFISERERGWKNPKHRSQWRNTIRDYCGPIARMPVSQIDTPDVLRVLKPIWTDKPETASRLRGRIERILDYARVSGHREGTNPALWRGVLEYSLDKPRKLVRGHHDALHYELVPALMARLSDVEAMSADALRFLILTASRTSEVLNATWGEFDLDAGIWTVPESRMKMGREHRVPLPQVLIDDLSVRMTRATGSPYVFPGQKRGRPLSTNAMDALFERHTTDLGKATVHGFRSSFRDWAGDETHYERDIIEHALARCAGDDTERSYRRLDALEKCRVLMQVWANFCEGREQDNVVTLRT